MNPDAPLTPPGSNELPQSAPGREGHASDDVERQLTEIFGSGVELFRTSLSTSGDDVTRKARDAAAEQITDRLSGQSDAVLHLWAKWNDVISALRDTQPRLAESLAQRLRVVEDHPHLRPRAVFDGDLHLDLLKEFTFPGDLVITGDLFASHCNGLGIAPGGCLQVEGDLHVENSRMIWPRLLRVIGEARIDGPIAFDIKDAIYIGGDLRITETRTVGLPPGTTIGGNLHIERCGHRDPMPTVAQQMLIGGVVTISPGLVVFGYATISDTKVGWIGEDAQICGGLELCRVDIGTPDQSHLPDRLRAHSLYLRDTPLLGLPHDLTGIGHIKIDGGSAAIRRQARKHNRALARQARG